MIGRALHPAVASLVIVVCLSTARVASAQKVSAAQAGLPDWLGGVLIAFAIAWAFVRLIETCHADAQLKASNKLAADKAKHEAEGRLYDALGKILAPPQAKAEQVEEPLQRRIQRFSQDLDAMKKATGFNSLDEVVQAIKKAAG